MMGDLTNVVAMQSTQISQQNYLINKQKQSLYSMNNDLENMRNYLDTKINEISENVSQVKSELVHFKNTTMDHFEQVENAFKTTLEVGGSASYYYPVAIATHTSNYDDKQANYTRSPLMFDIYRMYYEKAPESLNKHWRHYMGLSLKLMATGGGWDAGVNEFRVILHNWIYNKGVAKIKVGNYQEPRLFVWLRGGGVLYHINSPIDLTHRITVYYEENSETQPCWQTSCQQYQATYVSPIKVGDEDPNLVKEGKYDGWAF